MIDFDNTEIAFSGKSSKDLSRAYWLFKIIGNPILVKIGKALTNFALAVRLPVKGLIKATIFRQFCGGETIEESKETKNQLSKFNIKSILDYSIEGKDSTEDMESTADEIIRTIESGAQDPDVPFAVFKVTGIARLTILEKANNLEDKLTDSEKQELSAAINRIDRICKAAYDHDQPVFIDAEESWIQDFIDRTSRAMMAKYNGKRAIVYNTIQLYRHDRLAFLKNEIDLARNTGYFLGIKIVRGAYMEKERDRAKQLGYPSPIQPNKEACDKDYDDALRVMMENVDIVSICSGTHNEKSSALFAQLIDDSGLSRIDHRLYSAQLLGMSDHISYNLAHNGYNVAKYVPYGPLREVMPYLIRRADENTSVAGQTSRELSLIMKERKRRKSRA